MQNVTRILGMIIVLVTVVGCSSFSLKSKDVNWDFDHGVKFSQMQVTADTYKLIVMSNNKTHFSRLSTFLLRQSYKICGHYGFTLEMLSGIEMIDERRISPSYIQPNLTANLSCSSQ